jgi:hypothetical protein
MRGAQAPPAPKPRKRGTTPSPALGVRQVVRVLEDDTCPGAGNHGTLLAQRRSGTALPIDATLAFCDSSCTLAARLIQSRFEHKATAIRRRWSCR